MWTNSSYKSKGPSKLSVCKRKGFHFVNMIFWNEEYIYNFFKFVVHFCTRSSVWKIAGSKCKSQDVPSHTLWDQSLRWVCSPGFVLPPEWDSPQQVWRYWEQEMFRVLSKMFFWGDKKLYRGPCPLQKSVHWTLFWPIASWSAFWTMDFVNFSFWPFLELHFLRLWLITLSNPFQTGGAANSKALLFITAGRYVLAAVVYL